MGPGGFNEMQRQLQQDAVDHVGYGSAPEQNFSRCILTGARACIRSATSYSTTRKTSFSPTGESAMAKLLGKVCDSVATVSTSTARISSLTTSLYSTIRQNGSLHVSCAPKNSRSLMISWEPSSKGSHAAMQRPACS